jgi:hypothetical protein
VAPAARQDVPHRPGTGPHHRQHRAEADPGHRRALPPVDRRIPRLPARIAGRREQDRTQGQPARYPAGLRLHPGGRQGRPLSHGQERRGAHRLHGQRRGPAGAVRQEQAPVQLLQAVVRPGDEPAHRPDPGRDRHVAHLLHRSQAQPDGPDRSERGADPASGSDPAPVDAGRPGPSGGHRVPDPGPLQVPGAGHHLPGRRGRRRLRGRPGPPGHRRRGIRGRRLQHPDSVRPQRGCRPGRHSRPAGLFRRAPRPGTQGPAHQHRPGGGHRLRPRDPPLRPAGRLRRRGRVPLAGPGDHQGLLRRRLQRIAEEIRQGGGQGPQQGHVQDGHLHLPVLLRRPDLRSGGPQQRLHPQLLHRHRLPGGRRGPEGSGGGSRAHPPRRLLRRSRPGHHAGCRRRIRLPHPGRRAHVDAGRHRQAPARHPRQPVRHLQGICPHHQRPEQAPDDPARPVRDQARRPARAPGGSGIRQGDRQAFRHRRHVPGLHLHRGPLAPWPSP